MRSDPTPARSCEHERAALRLALDLTALVLLADTFTDDHAPVRGDSYARCDWARNRLLPLASLIPAVRRVAVVLDWTTAGRALNDPAEIRRRLDRVAGQIAVLAKAVRS